MVEDVEGRIVGERVGEGFGVGVGLEVFVCLSFLL